MPPDPSNGPTSAYEVTAEDIANGTLLTDTLCPKFDDDFWHINVSGQRQIVVLTVDYGKSGDFRLATDWFGPKSLCMRTDRSTCAADAECDSQSCTTSDATCTPCGGTRRTCRGGSCGSSDTNCTTCNGTPVCIGGTCTAASTDCATCGGAQGYECSGGKCDTVRNGCRAASAADCFADTHCGSSEVCTVGADINHLDLLATATEPNAGGTQHRLTTSVAAFIPGDYYARIYDTTNTVEDSKTSYELEVEVKADPDVYEPNNGLNMATDLAALMSGGTVTLTGYFSYVGDEDWFTLDPSVAPLSINGPPVVTIDLSWPDGTLSSPSWTLTRGGREIPAPTAFTGGNRTTLRSTVVMPSEGPLALRVFNPNNVTDDVSGYTLTVTVAADPYEKNARNDTASTATPLSVGAAGSSPVPHTETLAAENDFDWYRVTKTGSGNSLLQIHVESANPTGAPYLLEVQVHRKESWACNAQQGCPAQTASAPYHPEGECLLSENKCLTTFAKRPSHELYQGQPDGESDEFGGPTPNILDFQIPFYQADAGGLYIVVRQGTKSQALVAGFSPTIPYTLTLTHKVEPDPGDATNEDSCYQPRPLFNTYFECRTGGVYGPEITADPDEGPGIEAFFKQIDAGTRKILSGTATTGGGAPSSGFAMLTGPMNAPPGAPGPTNCTKMSFQVYDNKGQPTTTPDTFALNVSSGTLWPNANCSLDTPTPTLLPASVSLPTTDVYYEAPTVANAPTSKYVTVTVGGIESYLPVAATQPPQLSVSGSHASYMGSPTANLTAAIPSAQAGRTDLLVEVLTANGGSICTQSATSSDCPNVGTGGLARPPACPKTGAGSASCQLPIAAAGTTYGFKVVPSAIGLVALRISDTQVPARWVPTSWVVAGQGQRTFAYSGSATGHGYISYEGDNDFFTIPIPSDLAVPGGMTLDVNYTGPVQLRVAVTRESGDGQFDGGGIATKDYCSSPCSRPDVNECIIVKNGGAQLDVWVNGINSRFRDDTGEYSFTVTYKEGCPTDCPSLYCN